jgi:hypothetical protein
MVSAEPQAAGPLSAESVQAWMRAHPDRLRELVAEEGAGQRDPSGDAAVRALLRHAAEGIEATAGPPLDAAVAGFADRLPELLEAGREIFDDHVARGAGAIALEEHLQHGARPGSDPSLDAAFARRLRVSAWTRLFLLALEAHLGPERDGLAEAALAWTAGNQRELGRVIFALDRRGRAAMAASQGRPVTALGAEELEEVGQAALVRAHVRLAIEAAAALLRG